MEAGLSASERQTVLLAAALGTVAALPALLPGMAQYLDNGPHLLEVHELALALREGGLARFTTRANAGMTVGLLNAPLAWTPLALLRALGLPLEAPYALATVAANAVFGAGVALLSQRIFQRPGAALLAAALAVAAPADLLGSGGALGGMWPHRLASGVLYLGLPMLVVRPRMTAVAAWLSAVVLLHAFPGQLAVAASLVVLGHAAVTRQWARAARLAGGLGLAALVTAVWWLPLLDARLRAIDDWWRAAPQDLLLMLVVPYLRGPWQAAGRVLPVGATAGWLWAALAWLGVGLALVRERARLRRPGARLLLAAAGALALAVTVVQVADVGLLGPIPYRHLVHWRTAVVLVAGLGLAGLGPRALAWPVLALPLAVPLLLLPALPHRLSPENDAALGAVDQAWADAADAGAQRVLQLDGYENPWAPPALHHSHLGSLAAVRHDVEVIGGWYGYSPIATTAALATGSGRLPGAARSEVEDAAAWLLGAMRHYGAQAVVSVDAPMTVALAASPAFTRLSPDEGPVAAFLRADLLRTSNHRDGSLRVAGAVTDARVDVDAPAHLEAVLTADGPVQVQVLRTWHPWWVATLDGAPVSVTRDAASGLCQLELPRGGTLSLTWQDRTGPGQLLSLVGVVLLISATAVGRLRERAS